MTPLIICAAVTGSGPAKTASHPVTPDDVVASAVAAWKAGAVMLHLHARLPDGDTTMRPEIYRELVSAIRAQGCDAIISLSAGDDGGRATHEQRLAVCEAGSELVSLALGSFNMGARLYDNRPAFAEQMLRRMEALGTAPDFEVFDTGHLLALNTLRSSADRPAWVTLAMGIKGCMPADARLLQLLLEQLPADAQWAVCVHGGDHERFVRVGMHALLHGGHIRTGLEDHCFTRPGELASSNATMVSQWVATAQVWGRPVATVAQARQLLRLPNITPAVQLPAAYA